MIVCVCHNVSERRLEQAIHEGADSMRALSEQLGIARSCGKCAHQCKAMLNTASETAYSPLRETALCA